MLIQILVNSEQAWLSVWSMLRGNSRNVYILHASYTFHYYSYF